MLAPKVVKPGEAVDPPPPSSEQSGQELRPLPRPSNLQVLKEVNYFAPGALFLHMHRWTQQFGKIMALWHPSRKFVIVADADVAKHILQTNVSNYDKGMLTELMDFFLGTGLITANGDIAVTRRKAISPAFHLKYVKSLIKLFGNTAMRGVSYLQDQHSKGKPVNIEDVFAQISLDVLGQAVFEHDFDALNQEDEFFSAVSLVLREAELRSISPFAYWEVDWLCAILPNQRRMAAAMELINAKLDSLVTECEALVASEDADEDNNEQDRGFSILRFLLSTGDKVSRKQLRDDLMTLLIAGHESTAAVLTWTIHELLQKPEYLHRLREEADAVLGDRLPTIEDFPRLPFAHQVMFEALRLYPQPPVLIRRALADDVYKGYHVPAGSDVFISSYSIQRHQDYWEDPHTFNPDRFPAETRVPTDLTNSFKYLPFGGGPRRCIGEQFSLFEGVTMLSVLTRRFDFEMAPNAPKVEMTSGATIHTLNGLLVNATPRHVPQ